VAGFAQFAHNPQCFVKVTPDGNGGCAVHQCLGEFALRDFAVGQKNDAFHFGAGGVGGGGSGGVARAGTNHDSGAALFGLGDRHGHPAVFKGTGGVEGLIFQIQFEPAADCFDKIWRWDQRCIAFIEGDDRRFVRDGQVVRIAVDDALPTIVFGCWG
jgi:hypothetical protein